MFWIILITAFLAVIILFVANVRFRDLECTINSQAKLIQSQMRSETAYKKLCGHQQDKLDAEIQDYMSLSDRHEVVQEQLRSAHRECDRLKESLSIAGTLSQARLQEIRRYKSLANYCIAKWQSGSFKDQNDAMLTKTQAWARLNKIAS